MTTIGERIVTQAWDLTWKAPYAGLNFGILGATYAHFAVVPLELAAKAYAVWGVTGAIFKCLASIVTHDSKKVAMLEVGGLTIINIIGIQKLREMGLMGNLLTVAVIIYQFLDAANILKKNGLIT